MNELLEKILEALFAEALAGIVVDRAKGAPTRLVARIKSFRGWSKVKPLDDELFIREGVWHWHLQKKDMSP